MTQFKGLTSFATLTSVRHLPTSKIIGFIQRIHSSNLDSLHPGYLTSLVTRTNHTIQTIGVSRFDMSLRRRTGSGQHRYATKTSYTDNGHWLLTAHVRTTCRFDQCRPK